MALELNICEFSIRKVVKICLRMRAYKRKKIHFLGEHVKEKRLPRSEGELGWHATSGLENILLSDEKIFTIHEVSNSQKDRIISLTTCSIKETSKFACLRSRLADTLCPPEAPFGRLGSHWLIIRGIASLNMSVLLL